MFVGGSVLKEKMANLRPKCASFKIDRKPIQKWETFKTKDDFIIFGLMKVVVGHLKYHILYSKMHTFDKRSETTFINQTSPK